ncbi:MAG: lytic murein transglycosylase B [Candidatus Wenzhouxiangella sp. M2_3B_020]
MNHSIAVACLALAGLLAGLFAAPTSHAHPGAEAFAERVAADGDLSVEEVLAILERAEYQQAIIDAITRPAESKPWHEYRGIFIRDSRIDAGVEFWNQHGALVERIAEAFGVAPEFILAIVGVETNYGTITGSYRVLDALVTLGFYYPRRGAFFASELAEFFRLSREEGLPLERIQGSYAGAMGLGQFIPSSYRAYAVDFDESGSRDLWRSLPDALASVANYLDVHGWEAGRPTVLDVASVPEGLDADFPIKPAHTLGELRAMGVVFQDAGLADETPATLIEMEGESGPVHWIGLNNFYVITRYNRSPLYAMAVTQLADRLAERAKAD